MGVSLSFLSSFRQDGAHATHISISYTKEPLWLQQSPSTLAHMDAQSVAGGWEDWAGAGIASIRGGLPSLQEDLLIDFGASLSNSQEQAGENHPGMLRGKDWQIPSHHSIPHFLLGVPRFDEVVEWLNKEANPMEEMATIQESWQFELL